MAFTLDDIVPWGRSFEEYRRMFDLSRDVLTRRLLGCGDGPASFNAEATRRGISVVSVDPIYAFDADAIEERVEQTHDDVLQQLIQNREDYVWDDAQNPKNLAQKRLQAMRVFLEDFRSSADGSRYVTGKLPTLPFDDSAFDLALCSHLLFLYGDQLTASFHVASIREMLRVAREVRIFPLLTLGGRSSPHVDKVVRFCRNRGYDAERLKVDYEFQRGANEVLVVRRM